MRLIRQDSKIGKRVNEREFDAFNDASNDWVSLGGFGAIKWRYCMKRQMVIDCEEASTWVRGKGRKESEEEKKKESCRQN